MENIMEYTSIDALRNNCTLVAVREISGRPDAEIIGAFLNAGYRPHHGMYRHAYLNILRKMGFEMERVGVKIDGRSGTWVTRENAWTTREVYVDTSKMTLSMFCKTYSTGTYLVGVSSHALVVRDGVVVDPNFNKKGMRRRVEDAFLVKNPAPSRYLDGKQLRIKRGSDPLVYFTGSSQRSKKQESYRREMEASNYAYRSVGYMDRKPVRLSDILKNTPYLRRDAAWDVARGRLVIVSDK